MHARNLLRHTTPHHITSHHITSTHNTAQRISTECQFVHTHTTTTECVIFRTALNRVLRYCPFHDRTSPPVHDTQRKQSALSSIAACHNDITAALQHCSTAALQHCSTAALVLSRKTLTSAPVRSMTTGNAMLGATDVVNRSRHRTPIVFSAFRSITRAWSVAVPACMQ